MTKPRIDHIDRDKLKTDEDRAIYDALARAVEQYEKENKDDAYNGKAD